MSVRETAEKGAAEGLARVEAVIASWPDGEDAGERYGDPRGYYLGIAKRDIRKALADAEARVLTPAERTDDE